MIDDTKRYNLVGGKLEEHPDGLLCWSSDYDDLGYELDSLKQSVGYIVARAKERRVD